MQVTVLETYPSGVSKKNFNIKSRKPKQQNQNHFFAIRDAHCRAGPSAGFWIWSFQCPSWSIERYLHKRQAYVCHTHAVSELRL